MTSGQRIIKYYTFKTVPNPDIIAYTNGKDEL